MSRTYNDPGQRSNFINGTGAVDIYGLDAYPQGFDCSHPRTWRPVTTNYHQYHIQNNPSQPWYIPEFQGGSFDPWGGPGYDACELLTGPDFQDVFYKHNWASNAKLISYYMLYGRVITFFPQTFCLLTVSTVARAGVLSPSQVYTPGTSQLQITQRV